MAPVAMPPKESTEEVENESPPIKTVIGIIYPPPEVRNIVDKTASFVARNGPEFESRIRQNELNNPKFNFLNPTDPYHAYYQYKVREFKEGKGQEPAAPKFVPASVLSAKPREEQIKIIEPIVPKEPPPEFEFIADPPSISAFDLDVVKLTAQFVARNGRQFLTNLMNREKSYQFDFLRPQHSLFNYFTKLVEQYTKVLIPPKDLIPRLKKEGDNPKEILEQVKYRVEWAKFQEREKRKEEEAIERERVQYASIDWHDFVVVETVDFQPNEPGNFPPPTTPDEVGARLLAQERFDPTAEDQTVEMDVESEDEEEEEEEEEEETEEKEDEKEDSGDEVEITGTTNRGANTQIQDMEEDSDDEVEIIPPPKSVMPSEVPLPREKSPPPRPPSPPKLVRDIPQPPPLPPQPDKVLIKKDYDPKAPKVVAVTPQPDKYLVSPITGEKIPADKIQEHMRIGLLDPKWIEQRDRQLSEKREQEDVFAAGSSIGSNLQLLAERRTDIFGSGAEEAQIGKKIGEEDKRVKEKVTWDGHTASMERVTQKARENISIEEQIAVIHKVKGLLPDEEKEKIGPAMPKSVPPPPPPPSRPPPPPAPPRNPPPPPPSMPKPPAPPKPPPQQMLSRPPLPPPPSPVMMQAPRMMVMPQRPPAPPMSAPLMGIQTRPPMPPMGHMGGHPPHFMPPPPSMGGPPGVMGGPPRMPPPPPQMQRQDGEPLAKKAKTEDDLMPEMEFLKRNRGPVTFRVAVPNLPDKAEWKLQGQMLTFTLPVTDSVSVIKAKLHETLGMPAGKQKLQNDGLFIKDSNTLAFYNIMRNSVIQLQLKERGGRKK